MSSEPAFRPVVPAAPMPPAGLRLVRRARVPFWLWPVLGWCRLELPAWGRLYRWCGGEDERRWRAAGRRTVRGKWHGCTLDLDLGNWSERLSWFLARYHDLALQMLLRRLLRPGDAFVDVGANHGLLTVLGAHLVGPAGTVVAFEPNPEAAAAIAGHVGRNRLGNVSLHPCGLGEVAGDGVLHVFAGHDGWGSLSGAAPAGAALSQTHRITVRRGDEMLAGLAAGTPVVCKIDVEGWEVAVLRGLRQTLARLRPALVLEVVPEHLHRAGSSVDELLGFLHEQGYRPFGVRAARRLLRRRLELVRWTPGLPGCEPDVLFLPDNGAHRPRLQALLRR